MLIIHQVNGCPCGDSVIHLYCGADSTKQQEVCEKLLVFLKGSNYRKSALHNQEPTLYAHFQLIWKIRVDHMVPDLPSYVFFLKCCYKQGCLHLWCQAGPPPSLSTWCPGGPTLNQLPLPIPDPKRQWGSACSDCKGFCVGHYQTQLVDVCDPAAFSRVPKPPSAVLKQLFSSSNGVISEDMVESAAKKVLLPPHECSIWLNHLSTILENKCKGAQKAAATRQAKRSQAGGYREWIQDVSTSS